ncbi:hypothetical protein TNCV_1189711 [Trichonephila clavipes]|nr:hypothetical protein TNCV_1189711 [Trichonephila clavipes]
MVSILISLNIRRTDGDSTESIEAFVDVRGGRDPSRQQRGTQFRLNVHPPQVHFFGTIWAPCRSKNPGRHSSKEQCPSHKDKQL